MISVIVSKEVRCTLRLAVARAAAAAVNAELGMTAVWQVGVALVSDSRIRTLNKMFRGRDAVTDVLSFADATDTVGWPESGEYLGDIIISYPQAARQAKQAGVTIKQEVSLLIVHGLLHLLGYDHEQSRAAAAVMDQLQQRCVRRLGFPLDMRYNKQKTARLV
ncbi:rRNA maturation RNase YbeY [Candidatus Falkowbacteria bacterium]|nr:rRNA maturation RNase YbeY [Candidatus Falkowbacteria bacterium]